MPLQPFVALPPPDTAHALPLIPARIAGLRDLAGNLVWSWNRDARALFDSIDERLWYSTRHSPLRLLQQVDPERLIACAADPKFVAHYDRVIGWFRSERDDSRTWFAANYPALRGGAPIAYFCAEFGFHNSIPIYSGGLGVLAGDHCKTASDLGVPLVGIGILYRNGYFDQRVNLEGWQESSDDLLDLGHVPIAPITGAKGADHLVSVKMSGREVHIRAWRMAVGRVPIILLDTDLPENHEEDRPLLSRLYAGGPPLRLHQEWLLGVGGVRVLRALGIMPGMWHANEGHAAFMLVERVRELVHDGVAFDDAVHQVRMSSLFTTHTPVPAGHDIFSADLVDAMLQDSWKDLGITRQQFFSLGHHPSIDHESFHMTALAIRLSRGVNAVSARHAITTRELWRPLWPAREADRVPVTHVTNGVHLATWVANAMMRLFDRHLGNWGGNLDDPGMWAQVLQIPDEDLWATHSHLKRVLLESIRESARQAFTTRALEAAQIVGAGTLLNNRCFTIGFARRFATYKRADLIFHDPERLRRIVTNPKHPVQIVFSGKAHPADTPGKQVLQRVYQFTRDPRFEGRIAFLDDYGMHLAHLLVQGVDLWMNLPRAPMEASGTSGMKAALNGVPQLGTADGWWEEGFDGKNGWAVAAREGEDADAEAAERVYRLLETDVVPRFYDRPAIDSPPPRWLVTMKHAILRAGLDFTARRMLSEYVKNHYAPALAGLVRSDDPPTD
ncbi:MAG TPA: alpha-glucan family phosphorylase [Gemmatimonadaceae bacterium]|nr:alpha-glucan family phosphorylase [Gemmatimonadaceae bacterium]